GRNGYTPGQSGTPQRDNRGFGQIQPEVQPQAPDVSQPQGRFSQRPGNPQPGTVQPGIAQPATVQPGTAQPQPTPGRQPYAPQNAQPGATQPNNQPGGADTRWGNRGHGGYNQPSQTPQVQPQPQIQSQPQPQVQPQ